MVSSSPLVSIITVVYNGESYIDSTINSVLNQSYSNIEYIVIDGASSDGTMEIVNKYKDRISHIISEPDDGLYEAMNKGIQIASGSLVGIINSDDYYSLDTIEMVVKKYCTYGDKYIFHGNLALLNNDRKVDKVLKTNVSSLFFMRSGCTIAHPTVFIPRSMYKKYGHFDTKYSIASDYDLLLRFLREDSVKDMYIDKCMVYFGDGGLSSDIMKASYESHLVRLNNNFIFFESYAYFFKSFIFYQLLHIFRS
jgi:glycosyltransferase involved in cell wall biosynthesis